MEKKVWVNQAREYAKKVVGLEFGGKFWKNEEKREWVEQSKDIWYLDGTPRKGTVLLELLDNDLPSIIAFNTFDQIILEFKYPENPKVKYGEWYHNNYKREDLDTKVSEMIHSNIETEEIVSMIIDTIFSDIEDNPEKKINEFREEYI